MKPFARLLLVLVVVALALGGCLDPISILTDTRPTPAANGGRVRELPGPTTPPKSDQTGTPARPIDTSDLIREPVSEADRADEKLVETTDIPIGDLRELAIRFKAVPADTPLKLHGSPLRSGTKNSMS
jgi:hypothetical protein